MTPILDRYFGLAERGTDVRTELTASMTTFLTMAYIAFVNPQILADAGNVHPTAATARRGLY
ncbi:MAG: hypothetical protein J4F42_14625 [Desulfurellaceae bacterium]|nr:hypothetical protein [Desulfurellaceae bacterium]